ncbi:hypothetical protein NQ317_003710 [Molorchus minor]|uniref:Uncharacterized protein n=1 Tax=Molorchus minor TaxID=1323400 RepID=A0ABQ9K2D7_9CUCU|nr:hypothetical protein NQ317_003710 [Molorchus minor]
MSGVGFLVKTFTPGGRRRRRRCEKQQHKLELPGYGQCQLQPDVVPYWDTVAAPITPPSGLPAAWVQEDVLLQGAEKKEKTDGAAQNGALSPSNGETPSHITHPPAMEITPSSKPERPNSLGHGKQLTRRLLCYHNGQQGPTGGTPPPQEKQMHHLHPPHMMMNVAPSFMLSELPEPPIPVSEIGPIPPPPMFSSPSPIPNRLSPPPNHHEYDYDENDEDDDDEIEYDDDNSYMYRMSQPDPSIDTSRIDAIPAKEPKFHAVPLKSALKKKGEADLVRRRTRLRRRTGP